MTAIQRITVSHAAVLDLSVTTSTVFLTQQECVKQISAKMGAHVLKTTMIGSVFVQMVAQVVNVRNVEECVQQISAKMGAHVLKT